MRRFCAAAGAAIRENIPRNYALSSHGAGRRATEKALADSDVVLVTSQTHADPLADGGADPLSKPPGDAAGTNRSEIR